MSDRTMNAAELNREQAEQEQALKEAMRREVRIILEVPRAPTEGPPRKRTTLTHLHAHGRRAVAGGLAEAEEQRLAELLARIGDPSIKARKDPVKPRGGALAAARRAS